MQSIKERMDQVHGRQAELSENGCTIGEAVQGCLDRGNRQETTARVAVDVPGVGLEGEYRLRRPTNSERINRALVELRPAAFKIHLLLWKWRGAPARGSLPFFTIHSLAKFCVLSRPTVRKGLIELENKGWIQRLKYNKHHKNALYRLVAVRKIPPPRKECREDEQKPATERLGAVLPHPPP